MIDFCIELVVYKVVNADEAFAARREIMPIVEKLDGFKSWNAMQSRTDKLTFADYVLWEDCDKAQKAAKLFETDKRFARFYKSVGKIVSFQHYKSIHQK